MNKAPTNVRLAEWRDSPAPASPSTLLASPPSSSATCTSLSIPSPISDDCISSRPSSSPLLSAAARICSSDDIYAMMLAECISSSSPPISPGRSCPSPSLRRALPTADPASPSHLGSLPVSPRGPASCYKASASPPPVHPLSTSPARSVALDLSSPSPVAASLPPSAPSAPASPQPTPWWQWLLGRMWIAAKMCVMFSLVSVLWLILALPTIDQKLQAIFKSLRPLWTFGSKADVHVKNGKHPAHRSPVLKRKQEPASPAIDNAAAHEQLDNNSTTSKPLNGSQELRKSEEGICSGEENQTADQAKKDDRETNEADADPSARQKSKRKRIVKSVRWSDDASGQDS